MNTPHDNHHVQRLVLPSGKEIDVVYFGGLTSEASENRDLHICRYCSSQFVYPTAWAQSDPSHWRIKLRCPNCERQTEAICTQAEVELFDDQLDHGTNTLVDNLRCLVQKNMETEIERFAAALEADHIQPDDF